MPTPRSYVPTRNLHPHGRPDPYGEGWFVKMAPAEPGGESGDLVTGADGVAAYQAFLEVEGIDCGE